jgi:hypothetical protein
VKRARKVFTSLLALLFVAGCVGRFDYVRPVGPAAVRHSVAVEKSADEVWRSITSTLDVDQFAVHSLDKQSGLLIFMYHGDPERYVDCGHITSFVKNLRGERTYTFPAAAAFAEYELMTGKEILFVVRQMHLEARVTVTTVDTGAQRTSVSVDTRYVLTRTMTVRDTQDLARTTSHVVHFASGQEEAFPGAVTCRPNGRLEAEVLSALAK